MKIIWITTQFPSSANDTKGIFIFRTIKELSKHFDITVLCLYPVIPPLIPMIKNPRNSIELYKLWRAKYPRFPEPPKDLGANVIYAKYFRLPRGWFQSSEGRLAYYAIRKHLKKIITKQSIIHASWLFPEGDLASIIHKKFGLPYIVTLRGSDVNYLKVHSRKWEKVNEMLLSASYITSVSSALYTTLSEKKVNIREDKKALTHTIYDFEGFAIKESNLCRNKNDLNIKDKIIFFAGNLRKLKNINILIDSVYELQKKIPQLKLLIAGVGEEGNDLKKQVDKFGITECVLFLGSLNSSQMVDYYNAADVFCLPSRTEGTPNVIIEALLCGTPVVASAVGEIPYIIEDDKNGYKVEPGSVSSLSNSLHKALSREWDREALRASVAQLSPDAVIKEYYSVYDSISNQ